MTDTDPLGPEQPSIGRIIVGIDGSANASAAAAFAVYLSRVTGAPIVAVHAVGLLDRLRGEPTPMISHEHRDEIEAEFVDQWCQPLVGADFEPRLEDGNPASVLLRIATSAGDTIVVGRRGRGGFDELALGSISTQVLQHATVPVLVVPPPDQLGGMG